MTTIAELTPQLAKAKTALEADELREQVADLTAQLEHMRRRLKAEKGSNRRLRAKLDRLNGTVDTGRADGKDAKPASTAEGLVTYYDEAYRLATQLVLDLVKLRPYVDRAYATCAVREERAATGGHKDGEGAGV